MCLIGISSPEKAYPWIFSRTILRSMVWRALGLDLWVDEHPSIFCQYLSHKNLFGWPYHVYRYGEEVYPYFSLPMHEGIDGKDCQETSLSGDDWDQDLSNLPQFIIPRPSLSWGSHWQQLWVLIVVEQSTMYKFPVYEFVYRIGIDDLLSRDFCCVEQWKGSGHPKMLDRD